MRAETAGTRIPLLILYNTAESGPEKVRWTPKGAADARPTTPCYLSERTEYQHTSRSAKTRPHLFPSSPNSRLASRKLRQ